MTQTAILSRDYLATRDEVNAVPMPEATKTYFPIPNKLLLDTIEQACDQRGIQLESAAYGLNAARTQMAATFRLRGAVAVAPDFQLTMGVINSSDRSQAARLVSGAIIFACTNGCLSGEVSLARKHTRWGVRDLPNLAARAVDRFLTASIDQARTFDHWKTVEVTEDQATLLAVDAAEHQAVPPAGILAVRREFLAPRHREFLAEGGRRTAWTLYQAFTQYLTHDRERVSPIREQRDFLRVHRTLAEAFPVPGLVPSEN